MCICHGVVGRHKRTCPGNKPSSRVARYPCHVACALTGAIASKLGEEASVGTCGEAGGGSWSSCDLSPCLCDSLSPLLTCGAGTQGQECEQGDGLHGAVAEVRRTVAEVSQDGNLGKSEQKAVRGCVVQVCVIHSHEWQQAQPARRRRQAPCTSLDSQ